MFAMSEFGRIWRSPGPASVVYVAMTRAVNVVMPLNVLSIEQGQSGDACKALGLCT